MAAPYSGQCNCGAVSIRISGEPLEVRQCWCRQCQKVAGGFATTNAFFGTDEIALSGETSSHAYEAASGNILTHIFCRSCGNPIIAHSSARPHLQVVRLAMLDGNHGLAPTMAIWTDEAPSWAKIDPELTLFQRQPPPVRRKD